jgi:hypothetical protein
MNHFWPESSFLLLPRLTFLFVLTFADVLPMQNDKQGLASPSVNQSFEQDQRIVERSARAKSSFKRKG